MGRIDKRNMKRQGHSVFRVNSVEIFMGKKQKAFIRQVLEHKIIDIHTYKGDKGDLLIEITTLAHDIASDIEFEAKELGFEVVIIEDSICLYKVYCILYSKEIYSLENI